jgi:hypothetical protein
VHLAVKEMAPEKRVPSLKDLETLPEDMLHLQISSLFELLKWKSVDVVNYVVN